MRLPLLLLATLLPLAAIAAEPAKKDQPAVPAPPTVRGNGDAAVVPPEGAIEPEVTITTRGDATYEEFRANGRLYMVKVTPKKGKPYYLVYDEFGRAQRTDHQPSTVVPRWVIKTW